MSMHKSGNTPLLAIEELREKFNLPNLFIKDESANPFGTWKDRRSEVIIKNALDNKMDKLAFVTSGNTGYSLANFAKETDIKIVPIVDYTLTEEIKAVLKKMSHSLVEMNLEDRILESKDVIYVAHELGEETIEDVTNGYEDTYKSIAHELKEERPDVVVCPVGSGEAFIGIQEGFKELNMDTQLIGVTPVENPSLADKLATRWSPYQGRLPELIKISEEEIREGYNLVKKYFNCEPSGSVGIAVLEQLKLSPLLKIVVINSGKGIFVSDEKTP